MSASQDKKKRQAEREAGTDKWSEAEREEQKKKQKTKRQWTLGTVIVVLLVAVILLANSTLFYTVIPSVSVGDTKYTNAEYQYFYKNSYYNFSNQYSSMLSLFFDVNKPLKEQEFTASHAGYLGMFGVSVPESMQNPPAGSTWQDYFRESALATMTQLTAIYNAAVAEGYTLSEEDSASIDEELAGFDSAAASYNYSSGKNFISAYYGRGCTPDTIRKLLGMSLIASAYSQDKLDSFTYTGEELSTWYKDNKDSYDTFDYNAYFVAAETVEQTEDVTDEETGEVTQQTNNVTTEATMADAKKTAEAIAKAVRSGGESESLSFAEAVRETVPEAEDADISESTGVSGSRLSSVYSEWLLNSARKSGDVTVVESADSGYYVIQFLARGDNDYNTVSMRHILVNVTDTDADGAYSEEEIAAAKEEIEAIYSEWKSGDKTEDSFAALANEKSSDTGSNTNGGLYENVYNGQMVPEINDFLFEDGRKAGDTTLAFYDGSASNSYIGWHLVYFVGEDDVTYQDYLADSALRSQDYTAWQTSAVEGWTYSSNLVLKFAAV